MKYMNDLATAFWAQMSYDKASQFLIKLSIRACIIIAIVIATRIIIKLAKNGIIKVCNTQNIDDHTSLIFHKIVKYSINSLGIVFALQNIGVDVSALVAALGISGVALSFGMKDTVSNIIAGILIMLYKQFKVGDYLKIKDWEGEVIDINIRYTTLKTDISTVFIPNSILYSMTMAIIDKK